MSLRYHTSEELLERALRTIPLGSQTFSKSKAQYPYGVSPYFIQRGQGSHVWDVDGNEYIDFINGLASVTLGYNDPDVAMAVKTQLEAGTIFSLPHPIEVQVAEKIVEMIPCADMVRFGKNGSDATSGAIRLARAYTGRDHVAVCGYHGWQDWYIGSTARNRGVPCVVRDLTHSFTYNNLDSLGQVFKKYTDKIAAVIMEPMNAVDPEPGFLAGVKELCRKNHAVLVFDETITGFRYANGGAQEYFGVVPDVATFGKGLANGYPVSAIAGRADIMRLMEEIFFSSTFGGETLSLTAALATMNKLQTKPVIATMISQGKKIIEHLRALIDQHRVGHIVSIAGHPTWSFLTIKDAAPYDALSLKSLFMQEMHARGILSFGTHNLNYCHSDSDLENLFSAYDAFFNIVRDAVENRKLNDYLRCEPLQPVFKVR